MRINFELLDLRAFLAVFDTGNFHTAAELLNMSQPALSRRIKGLETRLGVPLLERSTRRVVPTAAGRTLEPITRRLLDELETSLMSIGIGEKLSGQITIASIPTAALYFLPKVLRKFNARYPQIRVRVLNLPPEEGLASVIQGEAEFGINMVGSTETDVLFTPLMDDPYMLACHKDHPLARKRTIKWKDLEGHRLIRIGRGNSGNRAVLDAALAKAGVQLDWVYDINDLSASLGLVEAGLACSVLPKLTTPRQARPDIVMRRIQSPEVFRTIGIAERRRGRLSPQARSLRQIIVDDWSTATRQGRAEAS